jgi:N-hydroxyarylamine O-acetyltransferase
LRTDPDSIFVQNLIVQRYTPGGFLSLVGRTLSTITPDSRDLHLIGSADELLEVLDGKFGIEEPEAAGLWDRVCERHEALFGARA